LAVELDDEVTIDRAVKEFKPLNACVAAKGRHF